MEARVDGEYLNAGDEIAVYDGNRCVGVSCLQGPLSLNKSLELIAGKDDGSSNGFTAGNKN
jgi:hypothetical protein